jgi:predicted secreted protein
MTKTLPILFLGASLLVGCDDATKVTVVRDGKQADENTISFTVQAEKLLLTDKVMVDLAIVQRGADVAALTQTVNATTAEVMKIARASVEVESKTTGFSTNQSYGPTPGYISAPPSSGYDSPPTAAPPAEPAQPQPEWEVSQGIHLESSNPKTLSELVGKFQGKVQISAVNYGLSSTAGNAVKQDMTASAIKDFRTRAQAIAKSMGYDQYRISSMSIQAWDEMPGSGSYYDYGNANGMMSAAPMPPNSGNSGTLVLEGGKQTYRLNVNGTIVVPDK